MQRTWAWSLSRSRKPSSGRDLRHGILLGDPAADLGVEVLGAGAGRLARHREAVAQSQNAEGQQTERTGRLEGERSKHTVRRCRVVASARHAIEGREVVLADDLGLDVGRRDARRHAGAGLDVALEGVGGRGGGRKG